MGGLFAWKWGEQSVEVLGSRTNLLGVLSAGSIHTEHPASSAQRSRNGQSVGFDEFRVQTLSSRKDLQDAGIGVGSRVVLGRERRKVTKLANGHLGGYFFDDRAALACWLQLASRPLEGVGYLASVSEELGGIGALYAFRCHQPDVCVALEIGPHRQERDESLTSDVVVWVADSYAFMAAEDIARVKRVAAAQGQTVTLSFFDRAGSDASCAAAHGLVARPITLGFAALNSHGFEVLHEDSLAQLTLLTAGVCADLRASIEKEA
jgi:putative aminopeptidase FrvX